MDTARALRLIFSHFFARDRMHFAHALIRVFALIGLTVVAIELSRDAIFTGRLLILVGAGLVWWYICHKTPLKRKV